VRFAPAGTYANDYLYGPDMVAECLDAVIVGAGFSGMGATIELKELGYDRVVVIEREDDLGVPGHDVGSGRVGLM
jgi:succinate dehydrogenase/fumarate reductase flavoprotein subunit